MFKTLSLQQDIGLTFLSRGYLLALASEIPFYMECVHEISEDIFGELNK